MKSSHPTYEQLVGMTAYSEQPVPIAFEDVNGHLNVRHYTGIASEGLDESFVALGIPPQWPAQGHAVFSAEHHLTYLAELRKAMTDDSPLGPREDGDDQLFDQGAEPQRSRFGRRR